MLLHLIKYRPLRDRIILWALLAVLAFCGIFPVRAKDAYLSDPFSASVLVSLAITAAVNAGSYALNYVIAKRRKVPKTDRGRMEDIRLTGNGYGEHVLRGYGKFRAAGLILDATPIIHTTSTTEGRPGGKGAPKPPEPGTINHVYTTTLDICVCESLGALSPDLKVTRIWEGMETIYDLTVSTLGDAFYEAERPGNTLAGGATTVVDASASGGSAVALPNGGSVQFNGMYGNGTGVVEFYYKTTAAHTIEITPSPLAMFTQAMHDSGGEWHVYRTAPFAMNSGFVNTLKIKNTTAGTIYIDNACVRISGQGTGVINPHTVASDADRLDPVARFGFIPEADGDGTTTAQIVAGGNVNVRIYNGSETQEPDSAFVALRGAGNVPAYRGLCHVVFDSYVLKEPAIPNFTFEVDTGVYDVDDIVVDLYGLVNVGSAKADVAALAGLALESDEGFLITSREEARRWLDDLMTCFQFDMPEVDGKVKAVLRNGSSVATVAADELRAHWSDEEAPDRELDISDADPLALPSELSVGYMDALLDYHTNTQTATVGSGVYGDRQTVNLSMILTASHARQLAATILWQRHQESRTFKLKLGPKAQKYHPGDVLTVAATNATHTVRLGEQRWQLMGVQEFEGVRQAASVYTQSIPGTAGSGYEAPVLLYPGTTKLVIMDLPILRPEDAGDGTQPVTYDGACLYGEGTWRGAFKWKEKPKDSGSYQFECAFDIEASIGVVASGSAGTIDRTVWDRSTALVFDFFPVTTLSSAEESDIANNPELNLLAIGSGSTWYVCQFTTATSGAASSPYNSRFTVSGFLWDRFGSGAPPAGSLAGLSVVVLNSAIKPRLTPLEDVGVARNYKCTTAGQSVDDAETVSFTLEGVSLRTLGPTNVRGVRSVADDLIVDWRRRDRLVPRLRDGVGAPMSEESEVYQFEAYSDASYATRVHGPVRIRERGFAPVFWVEGYEEDGAGAAVASDGGVSILVSVPGRRALLESAQRFTGEVFVEFTVDTAGYMPKIGFAEAGESVNSADSAPTLIHYFVGTGSTTVRIENAVNVTVATGDRIALRERGGVVDWFKNYTGETSVPVHRSVAPWDSSVVRKLVMIQEDASTNQYVLDASRVRMPLASYFYSADAQTADGLTPGATVYVKVYQESALVGRGQPTAAAL